MSKTLISLLSDAIGDTIACVPYISEYQKKTNNEVYYSINDSLIFLFGDLYPNINFIGRDYDISFDDIIKLDYIFYDSIQGGYAKQLGFDDPKYIRPKIIKPDLTRSIKNKYISMSVHSTSQLKYWNHPVGVKAQPLSVNWTELSKYIRKKGFTPVVVDKYDTFGVPPYFNGLPSKTNNKINKSLVEILNIINHSEFYIGLSSGMSWVAHALGKKVVMIANFTEDWNEFDINLPDYIRITNKSVCHGCWNNPQYTFDKRDWYWCPLHKGTNRQFECHTSITPGMVISALENNKLL